MSYRILGLDPAPFRDLFDRSESALRERGAIRYRVDAAPGFPDRVELRDAQPGEHVLLVNYEHQPADTPYRASHAIFVREGALVAAEIYDRIPEMLATRRLSLRAFDAAGMMTDAALVDGSAAGSAVTSLLADPRSAYVHAHTAARGCYLARIERA